MAGVYSILTLKSRERVFTPAHKNAMEESFAKVETSCGMLDELWTEIELSPNRIYTECYEDFEYEDNEMIREAVTEIIKKFALSCPSNSFMGKYSFDYSAVEATYYLLVFYKNNTLDIYTAYRDDMGWRESARKTWALKNGSFELTREEDLPDQFEEDGDWADEMGGDWDDGESDAEPEEDEAYSEQEEDESRNPIPDLLDAFDEDQFPED